MDGEGVQALLGDVGGLGDGARGPVDRLRAPAEQGLPEEVRPGLGQLVRASGQEDGQREGHDGRDRDDDHHEQVVQPGDFDEGVLVFQRQEGILFVVTDLAA